MLIQDERKELMHLWGGGSYISKDITNKRGLRFGIKGKLNPRFVGPFEILKIIGTLAYKLALLLPKLARVHNVFHISKLQRYILNMSYIIRYDDIDIAKQLSFEEKPIQILERKEHILRHKDITMVKVQWQHRTIMRMRPHGN